MNASRKQAESGFTLIEVLVASAIVIASIGILLQLFAVGLDQMRRSGLSGHRILVERQILSELKAMNPAMQNSGMGLSEGWHYQWQAEKMTEFRLIQISGVVTDKKSALFNVHVDLMQNEELEHSFDLLLLGWK